MLLSDVVFTMWYSIDQETEYAYICLGEELH